MADPQPTDAHLRVAHSINEQLMASELTKRQRKILDLILRLSWGCGKKEGAIIPRQRDFEVVGVTEGHIKSELDWLVDAKVIFIDGNRYSFNKDYDQWRLSRAKGYTPEKLTKLVSINLNHHKENLTETVSSGDKILPKQEDGTSQSGKKVLPKVVSSPDTNSASSKERLNKVLNKEEDHYISLNTIREEGDEDDEVATEITIKGGEVISAKELWSRVLLELKNHVTPANYDCWLKDTEGSAFLKGALYINLPRYGMEDSVERFKPIIKKVLTEITGKWLRVEGTY